MKQLGPLYFVRNMIFAGLLGLGLLFSNCSEVDFQTLPSEDQVGDLGGDGGNPITPIDPDSTDSTYGRLQSFVSERPKSKLDIMLVVDTSGSMNPELLELGNRLEGLVAGLEARGLDWQICFTQTAVYTDSAGLALRWLSPTGQGVAQTQTRVLNNTVSGYAAMFRATMQNVSSVEGFSASGDEQGIHALSLALESAANRDCFRSDAAFSAIVISDEDERSCGARCQSNSDYPTLTGRGLNNYTTQYRALTNINLGSSLVGKAANLLPNTPFTVHSIVIREGDTACYHAQDQSSIAFVGVEYSKLSRLTGGTIGNICAANYASQLTDIAARIQLAMTSVTLNCVPQGPISVEYVPNQTGITVSTSGNKLFFSREIPVGTRIDVRFSCEAGAI